MTQHIHLFHADCIVKLRSLSTGTVAAVLSDPPYGLGFMGKNWDKPDQLASDHEIAEEDPDEEGMPVTAADKRAFQRWAEGWLAECHRVLVPGGLAKVFGGTRMFHRMGAAMQNVGFQIEHLEAWTYGCLSDDSEILTKHGWKLGTEVEQGEVVACWDSSTGRIHLDTVEAVTVAPYQGDLVQFLNDNTDQLLTPNHRVYKKHRIRKMVEGVRHGTDETEWNVQEAGQIDRWNSIRLPLAGIQEGTGIGGPRWAALLGWVFTEGGFDLSGTGVRIYQSSVNEAHVRTIEALVQEFVPKYSHYTRVRKYKDREYTEHCWYFSGAVANKIRSELPGKHPTWDLMWAMTLEEKTAFVRAALDGDGSGDNTFYQKDPADLDWFQTLCHMMNRQGRVNPAKCYVALHYNPQTQLQGRHLRAAEKKPYDGLVWCVKVPTGAFVARRKGLIFITGNSGFPKSMNMQKIFTKQGEPEAALRFAAYGTALKPSWEPFLVGRKRG